MEPESSELISIRTSGIKKPSDASDKAEISINEFLNFLKTAYQVQDSVEGILLEGGMNEAANWLKSKELEFAQKGKNMSAQTSEAFLQKISADKKTDEKMLKKEGSFSNLNRNSEALKEKLNEVLSEGLLDSVLPYLMVQNSQSLKKISSSCISNKIADKTLINNLGASTSISNEKIARRKSSGDASCSTGKSVVTKSESEVEIHVCDEMKNTKKTFVCNQKLLVEKMGYFAEVTLGQKLEDMDISVHCDIGIFEWLMQWVKKNDVLDNEWPQLDSQCVIPILVSAAFLQMEPLLQDCLLYCHGHMNEILRSASNLNCLNDSVLTRLAAMYTNTEIESIKDRKDKIQSRLFTKMIQSLTEPDPESVRGHWCSLARIFRCEKCEQLLTPNVATKIPCIPSSMRLQPDGTIISLHFRDSTWNINTYIRKLQKTLKTWRKVYWRLWGDVHFLYCVICKKYFPANRIGWCQYHPDSPQFFTLDAQKAALPIGRYPCCGERAYRFQLLPNQSACQFRQHTVIISGVEDVKHSAIYAMLENYRDLIEEEPPELLFPERLTRLVARDSSVSEKFQCKESFWWDGFEIIPPRPKLGLLSAFSNRKSSGDSESLISEEISTTEEEEATDEDDTSISSTTSMESDEGSAESNPATKKEIIAHKSKNKRKNGKRLLWQHNLSARSNQDIQRAYEENILKEMSSMLTKKLLIEGGPRKMHKNLTSSGGIWLKLEADWRESVNQNNKDIQLKSKNLTTNRANKPRSRF